MKKLIIGLFFTALSISLCSFSEFDTESSAHDSADSTSVIIFSFPTVPGVNFTSIDIIPSEGKPTKPYSLICKAGEDSTKLLVSLDSRNLSGSEIFLIGNDGTDLYTARFKGFDSNSKNICRLSSDGFVKNSVLSSLNIPFTEYGQVSLSALGVPAGQYSAIVKVKDGRYAVVHDKAKGSGLYFLDLGFDANGNVTSASMNISKGASVASDVRDPEGIAFTGGHLFVAGEDQKILEYDLNGNLTGRSLKIPADLSSSNIQSNLGFESLATCSDKDGNSIIVTMTENSLLKDKDYAPSASCGPMLRFQSFDVSTLEPLQRRLYLMDKPQVTDVPYGSVYVHGVSDILGLPDGNIIVMEREVYVNTSKYRLNSFVKLYVVDPVNDEGAVLSKTLLDSFKTGFGNALSPLKLTLANYEGMCLGPTLEDGTSTILLINDSQGCPSYTAKGITLKLEDYIKTIKVRL